MKILTRKLIEKCYIAYSNIVYNIPMGYAPLPPLIIWLTTYKCNLRCKMCGFYGEGGKLPETKNELSFEEIKLVIDKLKISYRYLPYKPYIGFMGGEPFSFPYIFQTFKYLKDNNIKYAVTTNFASLNDEKIDKLINSDVNDLRISLDGPEEVHDRIRNMPGTFRKVMGNLEKIRSDVNGKKIPIRFNCVICPDNIDYLKEMPVMAKKFKADLAFQHLSFIDEKHHKENSRLTKNLLDEQIPMDLTTIRLTEDQIEKAKINIKEMLKKAKNLNVNVSFTPNLALREFHDYYFNLDEYTHSTYCNWPWGCARILPNGDVTSCMYYMFGNIRTKQFQEIWNGDRARKFRKILKTVKIFPGCIRCCKL